VNVSYSGGQDTLSVVLRNGLKRGGYWFGISPSGIRIEAVAFRGPTVIIKDTSHLFPPRIS